MLYLLFIYLKVDIGETCLDYERDLTNETLQERDYFVNDLTIVSLTNVNINKTSYITRSDY